VNRTFYDRIGKKWFDASFAVLGLLVISPILVLTAILIRLTSSGPVFFRQKRTGRLGKSFRIFKFRTMVWDEGKSGNRVTATDDPRITSLGRFLRRTKLDEIPQLLNVLRGEMSFVGPRPEVPEYTATYNLWQKRILIALPGITGPAAIAFVNEEEILAVQPDKDAFYRASLLPAKLDLDVAYCENIRFLTDLALIFKTVALLFDVRKPLNRPFQEQS
jgi:lipopolysaccharide/colanic/teichoic acid biosynthesis glycosyltransferase